MLALDNKVALIAGGSSGIGLAIAKRFVSEGAYVFITSRRQSELDKAVVEIGKNASFTVWLPIHLVGLSHPLGMQAHGDHEPIR